VSKKSEPSSKVFESDNVSNKPNYSLKISSRKSRDPPVSFFGATKTYISQSRHHNNILLKSPNQATLLMIALNQFLIQKSKSILLHNDNQPHLKNLV
jgi:hypothetical protein